jgi:hypothetical protein
MEFTTSHRVVIISIGLNALNQDAAALQGLGQGPADDVKPSRIRTSDRARGIVKCHYPTWRPNSYFETRSSR